MKSNAQFTFTDEQFLEIMSNPRTWSPVPMGERITTCPGCGSSMEQVLDVDRCTREDCGLCFRPHVCGTC